MKTVARSFVAGLSLAALARLGGAVEAASREKSAQIVAVPADLIDATHVRVAYDDDVSACRLWMIGDAAEWVWADGGATVGPFEGSISAV